MTYDRDPNHDLAVQTAIAQNESYGRMTAKMDRERNLFTQVSVRLGRVSRDYLPCGVSAQREERNHV